MNNFSIIIPVYNESKNIDLLVKEIYENLTEYKHFELIIINDSSTDNTEDILNEYYLILYILGDISICIGAPKLALRLNKFAAVLLPFL